MQNFGNRRSVQKCVQNAGSNVLKLDCWKNTMRQNMCCWFLFGDYRYPMLWKFMTLHIFHLVKIVIFPPLESICRDQFYRISCILVSLNKSDNINYEIDIIHTLVEWCWAWNWYSFIDKEQSIKFSWNNW